MIELLAGEPKPGETRNALIACNDYLRMGPGRSMAKLCDRYRSGAESYPGNPPTKRLGTLKTWSTNFDWQDRAAIYDQAAEDRKTAEAMRREVEAMNAGIALGYERVIELKTLFDQLKDELAKGLYYEDKKISAKGDVVEVEVFHNALIGQIRGVLDDVAKEVGGRRQQVDIEAKLEANVKGYVGISPDDWDDTTEDQPSQDL